MFGVEASKFLGFLLTKRGIEADPEKCAAIIAMRSPILVKKVQQLTGRMAALSRFVSAGGDKGHPYFHCLKRNNRFIWTQECEEAFVKLKEYLASPPVLCKPELGTPSPILCSYREGDQFGPVAGTRPGAEANLLHQQGIAGAKGEIPGLRKSSPDYSILSEKTLPLLPELHRDSNDRPSNPQGPAKAKCGRQNGALGGTTV